MKGNNKAKNASLGGKVKGNVNAEQINIKKRRDIDGVLNQKTLSIEEGATLKIKTQTQINTKTPTFLFYYIKNF
jgi:cytoskeletal protein CcmA (bactofilin family)